MFRVIKFETVTPLIYDTLTCSRIPSDYANFIPSSLSIGKSNSNESIILVCIRTCLILILLSAKGFRNQKEERERERTKERVNSELLTYSDKFVYNPMSRKFAQGNN